MLRLRCFAVSLPFVMFALAPVYAQELKPMPVNADPAFEVATIKPTDPSNQHQGFHQRGRRLQIENETVDSLMMFAYAVHAKQIVDAPEWLATAPFDVDGVPDVDGSPNLKQYQGIVRKLLLDRFHLKFHQEKRELPVYAIRQTKSGSKLIKSTHDPGEMPDQTGNGRTMEYTNNSMADFALGMQFILDRPVVDEAGLVGRYDFKLSWTSERTQTADPNAPPGLFTAVQEQLGLKFEPSKASITVMVVDKVDRPSEN